VRKYRFSVGAAWILAAVFLPAAGRADDQPAKPAKSFSSLKLPASDFSLALQTDRLGGTDRQRFPAGLPWAKREPAVPFVGLSLSKPLGVQK
jgi:hypothetical protein